MPEGGGRDATVHEQLCCYKRQNIKDKNMMLSCAASVLTTASRVESELTCEKTATRDGIISTDRCSVYTVDVECTAW